MYGGSPVPVGGFQGVFLQIVGHRGAGIECGDCGGCLSPGNREAQFCNLEDS